MPAPDAILDLLAPADALAVHLRAIADLVGITVIVDRQKDITSEVTQAVAKAKGAAIVIMLEGWSEPPEGESAYLRLRYSISLWTKPILRAGAISESIALGALVRAVQAWRPDASACARWHAGAGASTVNKEFRLYEFPASFEVTLFPES